MISQVVMASMLALATVGTTELPSGFFYMIGSLTPGEQEQLIRIDWDGQMEVIGYPQYRMCGYQSTICWDQESQSLYSIGTDSAGFSITFLSRISTETAATFPVAQDNFSSYFPNDTAFNPFDHRIYFENQNNQMLSMDTSTGDIQHEFRTAGRLAHIVLDDGVSGIAYTNNQGGLSIKRDDGLPDINIGGQSAGRWLFWDQATGMLFAATPWDSIDSRGLIIEKVDTATGNASLIDVIIFEHTVVYISQLDYAASDDHLIHCDEFMFDTDGDLDLDLQDFAIISNCFTGPAATP